MKLNGLVTGLGMTLMIVAARPAAAAITITVGDATATGGGTATFAVTLAGVTAGGVEANNAQLDIVFDTAVFDVTAGSVCTVDSRLAALTHTETLPTSPTVPAGMKRLRLNVIDTGATLGLVTDGTLYTCNFPVNAAAPAGATTLTAGRQNVGDNVGNPLDSSVVNGTVTVAPTTPTGIVITVGNATAAKGATATFTVTLSGVAAGGVEANNAQVDIVFDTAVFDVTAGSVCTVDPRLAALTHTETLPTSPAVPAGMKRIRLNVIDTGATLGLVTDGTLYTCNFPVNAAAPTGATTLEAGRQNVGDNVGNPLDSSVVNGIVTIGGPIGASPTPTNTVPAVSSATPSRTTTATASPTRTNTKPAASATPTTGGGTTPLEDEGGCQIGTSASGSTNWLLIVSGVGLLLMRRRARR